MRRKFFHALSVSLEWRAVAFIVTNIFFLFTTNSFWVATGLATLLQAILFVTYTLWYFIRFEGIPLFSFNNKNKKNNTPELRV